MEKERINLFETEPKKLPDGKVPAYVSLRRGGVAFLSVIALGVALFAIVFIICCFYFEFVDDYYIPRDEMTSDETTGDIADVTPSPDEADTDAVPDEDSSQNVGALLDKSFIEALKELLGLAGAETGDSGSGTSGNYENIGEVSPPAIDRDELYYFDRSLVPSGEIAIVPKDMSLSSYGDNYIYNDTSYAPAVGALRDASDVIPKFDYMGSAVYPVGDPIVLIIHTHGTEAYSPEGSISYKDEGELARSHEIDENVVAVGGVFSDELNRNGVRTLHCEIMHDKESYKDSYIRAASTIAQYLAKYPSIQYVIDLHRDSLTSSDGSLIRPVTLVDGIPTAQVMCVVGSNYNGADHPDWQDNLSLALKFRAELNDRYENISRPVYLRSSAYNQQYAPFSILLEVGASGNSLSEAKNAAILAAGVLADIIKGK